MFVVLIQLVIFSTLMYYFVLLCLVLSRNPIIKDYHLNSMWYPFGFLGAEIQKALQEKENEDEGK